MAITEISVSKIYVLATEPTNKVKDRFWFDTTNNLLKRYDGTTWKPISVSSDDVVVLSNGNKISLTSYLNTQIAALAEGIDSKQDKLKYYSEETATDGINVNISATTSSNINGTINLKAQSGGLDGSKYTSINLDGTSFSIDTTAIKPYTNNILKITTSDISESITGLSGSLITTSIADSDLQLPTSKAVKTELDKKANSSDLETKQDKLYTFTESKNSSSNWKSSITAEEIELKTGTNGNISINGPINNHFRVNDGYVYTLTKYRTTDADFYTDYGSRFIEVTEAYEGAGDTTFTIKNNTIINGNLTTQGNASAVDITASGNINYSGSLLKDGVDVLASKQNSTDTSLNTTDKTIVGAINELLSSINTNVITSTEQKRITTTSTSTGIQMSTTAKACMVSINPVKTNVGAIYISTSSDTTPTINPLYPDQMPKYKFPNASQVYIWSDVNGDSVDLTIEYYG